MRLEKMGLVAALAGALVGAVEAGVVGTIRGGSTGGGTAGGVVVAPEDCDVCTQAARCCEAVSRGRIDCRFSAADCSSKVGDARRGYLDACRAFLSVTREAWKGNPPAECR